MKSKPYWLQGGEPDEVADRADMQDLSDLDAEMHSGHFEELDPVLVDMPETTTVHRDFGDAKTRTMLALLDLAEHEEEVRMEAMLDDEIIDEIADAYDIEFQDDFERALFCEAIKAERIWKKAAVRESRSKIRAAARDSQAVI